jgi:LCP family protein required for cell wall assembly
VKQFKIRPKLHFPEAVRFKLGKNRSMMYTQERLLPEEKKVKPWWFWGLIGITGLALVLILGVMSVLGWYVRRFEQASSRSFRPVMEAIRQGWQTTIFEDKPYRTFLILGLDEIRNQREGSLLTDTLMVVVVKDSGDIKLVSIPRDLWIESLKTKINAVYYYGEIADETTGEELMNTVIDEILGIVPDYTMVVTLASLEALIDAVDGVALTVEQGFEDTRFPRDDVDLSSANPDELYETVKFEAGTQWFTGEQALKYIRSRHSLNGDEGNDLARTVRQQQVVLALAKRLVEPELWMDPGTAAELYSIWKSQIKTGLADHEVVALAKSLAGKEPAIRSVPMPVFDTGNTNGILLHPPPEKHALWVYEPVDPSWQQMHRWFRDSVGLEIRAWE